MLGKKLYKTSMLNIFRFVILALVIFFFNSFYLETFTYEKFQSGARFRIFDVLNYHFQYPAEFIAFFFIILTPAVYYSLIRGVRFHEKGFIFNRGIPFMNKTIMYEDIKFYKLLHPKFAISIHLKSGDLVVVADNHADRVMAILDQHNIHGDLAQDEYVKLLSNYRMLVITVVSFTAFLFLIKKLGLFAP